MNGIRWFARMIGWKNFLMVSDVIIVAAEVYGATRGIRHDEPAVAGVAFGVCSALTVLLCVGFALDRDEYLHVPSRADLGARRFIVKTALQALPGICLIGLAWAGVFASVTSTSGLAVWAVVIFMLAALTFIGETFLAAAVTPFLPSTSIRRQFGSTEDITREVAKWWLLKPRLRALLVIEPAAKRPFTGQRVNPMFLPGTALRFVTLFIVAVATTWNSWQILTGTLLGAPYRRALDRCANGVATVMQALYRGKGSGYVPLDPSTRASLAAAANRGCANTYDATTTGVSAAAVLVLLLTTFLLYWWWPAWDIRRKHFTVVREGRFPALERDISELAEHLGVKRVRILIDLADPRVSGRAFGRVRRRYVVLSRGLLVIHGTRRNVANAVIAHELAHIRNNDLDPSYAAVWVWRVFMVVTVVPMAIWSMWSVAAGSGSEALSLGWRSALAVVLGWSIRNWLLRSRESLADARAFSGGGREIHDFLAEQPAKPSSRARWLRLHPSPQQRSADLSDPRSLTAARFLPSAAIGVIAMLAYGVTDMVAAVAGLHSTLVPYVGATASTIVVTWSVSQNALRDALGQRFAGKNSGFFLNEPYIAHRVSDGYKKDRWLRDLRDHLVPGLRIGAGTAVGIVVGQMVALDPTADAFHGSGLSLRHWLNGWSLAVFGITFIIATWIFLAVRVWLPLIAETSHPRRYGLAALVTGCLITAPTLPHLFVEYMWYSRLPWERAGIKTIDADAALFDHGGKSTSIWILIGVAAVLIAAPLIPHINTLPRQPRDWVTLDPPAHSPWYPPGSTLRTALIAGFLVVAITYRVISGAPAAWLGFDTNAMALSAPDPIDRSVVLATPHADSPVSCQWVRRTYGDHKPSDPARALLYDNYTHGCQASGADNADFNSYQYNASRQDVVIYSPDGTAWYRSYVLAMPGDHVTCTGRGAFIAVNGRKPAGSIPAAEEARSDQPLDVVVPAGDVWVTGVHWDSTTEAVYRAGEPGGGLVTMKSVVAYESP